MDFVIGLAQNIFAAALGFVLARVIEWRRKRRMLAQVSRLAPGRAAHEAVLMLNCREDIEIAVRKVLATLDLTVDENNIVKVHHKGAFPDDEKAWMGYVGRVREAALRLRSDGFSRVHLFLNVPIAMAVFAGALLDNGPEVIVYHYFNGVYRRVGAVTSEAMYAQ